MTTVDVLIVAKESILIEKFKKNIKSHFFCPILYSKKTTVRTLSPLDMTKRRQEKGEVENDSPENEQLLDDISEISKESTYLPKKKRTKTRNNVSVTIEVMTRLDKENVQKLQRQRETLIAQGISESYPLQNSISPKLYDTIGQLLLLQDATDVEYDMEKENDIQKFAQYLQKNEKTVLELLV